MISVCLVIRNEESCIRNCLESIKDVVDEIIIVDGHSTDKTVDICKEYTNRIYYRKPQGFVEPDRAFALEKANGDWVLVLDGDETLSESLRKNIRKFTNQNKYSAFGFAKRCYYSHDRKKWTQHAFYPAYKICLYKKDSVSYRGIIHEHPIINGNTKLVDKKYYINHYTPDCYTYRHFRKKMLKYAQIQASQIKRTKPRWFYYIKAVVAATFYSTRDFLKGYWFLDGIVGFKASFYYLFLYFLAVFYYVGRGK